MSKTKPRKRYNWQAIKVAYLNAPNKPTLKELADKFEVNYRTLMNKAGQGNWRQMREDLEGKIALNQHKEMLSQRRQFVSGINQCAGLLLQQIEVILKRSEPLSTKEIASIASSLKYLADLGVGLDGDLSASVSSLIDAGIIPPDLYPQICEAIDHHESQFIDSMSSIFQGKCPD